MSGLNQRIEPFPALMFDAARCAPLSDVVAPPYDLIDQPRQDQLYARSPYNIVRLELNRDADPYTSAAHTLAQWLREGILARAPRPAIYFYTQAFESESRRLTRNGLIVRIRLEEFSQGRILPHERTFPAAKEDRLRLLTATRVNLSPIFGLYPSGNVELERLIAAVAARAPQIELTDDLGIANQVRPIHAPDEIAVIQNAMAEARILIADGHHRYETALDYRRRRRAAENNPARPRPYDYVMMTLVGFNDPGLVILPTHRLVHHLPPGALAVFPARIRETFDVEEFRDAGAMREALRHGRGALGVVLRGDPVFRILRLKNHDAMAAALPDAPKEVHELDVSVLHALILDRIFAMAPEEIRKGGNIEYTIDMRGALAAVASGKADGAFLMTPPTVQDVERVSGAGAVMPEKSTYFHPKLLTGLVMNSLDDPPA
ncbi:MAG: DUF1015 domain-containing protein [Candidatus Binataceae bacterium]